MKLYLLAALALVGCASPPQVVNKVKTPDYTEPVVAVQPALDPTCTRFAQVARAVAAFRDAGVSPENIVLLVKDPVDYPLGPVVREVYQRRDVTPEAGALNSYGVCVKVSFGALTAMLKTAEQEYINAEHLRIRDQIAAIQKPEPVVLKLDTGITIKDKKSTGFVCKDGVCRSK